jgi:hypothetical protein
MDTFSITFNDRMRSIFALKIEGTAENLTFKSFENMDPTVLQQISILCALLFFSWGHRMQTDFLLYKLHHAPADHKHNDIAQHIPT